ncbi:hypothetical protein GGR57DRAFT_19180 [Xylariaceae sp. FL1272]|nr:hypothetical protein GGR57DRAFT_19180 [Xylariaceae sp. FL1272]
MFSSGSSSANFKGPRRKISNDGRGTNTTQILVSRPSTASPSLGDNEQTIIGLLEPALDGPPSPEGLRAISQHMKRGSMTGPRRRELTISSASSSLHSGSATPETPRWEHSLEDVGLSRNSSQRSSGMPARDRPESIQIFSKSVFTRKGKLRREMSEQGFSSGFSSSKTLEQDVGSVADLPRDQRFMQSIFARRRPRGQSENSKSKVVQISGPYNFQHVAHTAKQSLSSLDEVKRRGSAFELSIMSPQHQVDAFTGLETTTDQTNVSDTPLSLDKPLPAPPRLSDDIETVTSSNSIQVSPLPSPDYVPSDIRASPILPPPRTSSRIGSRHGQTDSFEERPNTSSSLIQSQLFRSASTDSLRPTPASHPSSMFPGDDSATEGNNSPASQSVAQFDAAHWPLANSSMSSLAEVPEEEDEYHLEQITSGTSFASNPLSLRGSISVPYLRRVTLNQALQRPPSNASDTLGSFDLFAAQRALRNSSDLSGSETDGDAVDNWEDDIDYCYEHAAEATDDFAWERPSVDLEDRERGHAQSLTASHRRAESRAGPNFSLPRMSSSKSLPRDHDRSPSNASSFQEAQGFSLSPSLLIPNDYFEQMLQHERGEQSAGNETQHHDQYLKSEKSFPLVQGRSSVSTSVSTYSDRSVSSSRHQSSSSSSAYTRWTGSSNSSWQAQIVDTYKAPVSITLNDKEDIATPTADVTPRSNEHSLKPEVVREGHNRTQSDATLLMRCANDTVPPVDSKTSKDSGKFHRRARTSSRSHNNAAPPQFALFPQVSRRV